MHLADIIAQPKAIEAIHIALASPYPCSLLITGATGSGKSTLLSAVRELPCKRRVLSLPATLSIEELGEHSDIAQTLHQGRLVQQQSLEERMQGAIVLLDNVQMMSAEVLASLLEIQASSIGLGAICLIAVANTQDGSLRSTLLDRFDMYVELLPLRDPLMRIQVIRHVQRSQSLQLSPDHTTVQRLADYRERCTRLEPRECDIALSAEICRNAFVLGHRADIALLRIASVYAAMQGRSTLLSEDFAMARDLVLTHRLNNTQTSAEDSRDSTYPDEPSPPTDTNEGHNERQETSSLEHPLKQSAASEEDASDETTKLSDSPPLSRGQGVIPEQCEDIGALELQSDPISLMARCSKSATGPGTRLKSLVARPRGRYYKATIENVKGQYRVALLATLREAIPYQGQRRRAQASELAIIIASSDLRYQLCRRRTGYHILFAVDASGSMGAKRRMHRVKGLIIELLRRAYEERDYVGLLTFRGDEAVLKLPLTKSISRAHSLLQGLQTGGRTPLFLGLSRSLEVLKHTARKSKGITPVLVVVTDGRATSRYAGENSPEALRRLGVELRQIGTKILVIDSEEGFIKMGKAQALAEALGAEACYPMHELIKHREQEIYSSDKSTGIQYTT